MKLVFHNLNITAGSIDIPEGYEAIYSYPDNWTTIVVILKLSKKKKAEKKEIVKEQSTGSAKLQFEQLFKTKI